MTDKDQVLEFLRGNPDFFSEFPELLQQMSADNAAEASPFIERQLKVLKDRETQQQQRIDLIIDSVRDIQKLEKDLIQFACALLGQAPVLADPRRCVLALLEQQFSIPVAVLALARDVPAHDCFEDLAQRVGHGGSACDDRLGSSVLKALFGEKSETIGSCAFVPISADSSVKGILA